MEIDENRGGRIGLKNNQQLGRYYVKQKESIGKHR